MRATDWPEKHPKIGKKLCSLLLFGKPDLWFSMLFVARFQNGTPAPTKNRSDSSIMSHPRLCRIQNPIWSIQHMRFNYHKQGAPSSYGFKSYLPHSNNRHPLEKQLAIYLIQANPIYLIQFGSVRFGSVRFGSVRFGSVRFGSVRFCSVLFCSVLFCSICPSKYLSMSIHVYTDYIYIYVYVYVYVYVYIKYMYVYIYIHM